MELPSHEVSARMAWAVVRMLERGDYPTERLFEGLPFDAEGLRQRRRISWDDYVTIVENSAAIVGTAEDLDALIEDEYHAVLPELRVLGRALIEPKAFLRLIVEVLDPIVWPALHGECVDLGDNEVKVTIRIRPGARPCRMFMQCSVGALRGVTRHLDLPPTKILRTEIGDDYGIYWVRLPPSRTIFKRASAASAAVLKRVTAAALMGDGEVEDPLETRIDGYTVAWGLSRRQIDVLRRLADGKANKEIAQDLGCAENTVELHVTQLLKKSKTSSRAQLIAQFWREG